MPRLLVSGEQQIVWVFSRPTDVGKDSQHLEHYGCDKKYSDKDGINNKRKIGIPQRFHERSTSAAIQIFMPVRFSTPHESQPDFVVTVLVVSFETVSEAVPGLRYGTGCQTTVAKHRHRRRARLLARAGRRRKRRDSRAGIAGR